MSKYISLGKFGKNFFYYNLKNSKIQKLDLTTFPKTNSFLPYILAILIFAISFLSPEVFNLENKISRTILLISILVLIIIVLAISLSKQDKKINLLDYQFEENEWKTFITIQKKSSKIMLITILILLALDILFIYLIINKYTISRMIIYIVISMLLIFYLLSSQYKRYNIINKITN